MFLIRIIWKDQDFPNNISEAIKKFTEIYIRKPEAPSAINIYKRSSKNKSIVALLIILEIRTHTIQSIIPMQYISFSSAVWACSTDL